MTPGVAWVTGASTGIGRALCLELATRGWTVAASARDAAKLAELAAGPGAAAHIRAVPLDVTDGDAVRNAVAGIEEAFGRIDLAVLNAGSHRPMPADAFSADGLRALVDVNLMGPGHCLEALLPRMIGRGRGRVMLVASVAGYRGLPTASAYGATKAALINMGEALRVELESRGILVQVVNPGFVKTPLTDRNPFPMPFLVTADTAARRIADGLKTRRFEITFPRRFTWLLKLARCLPYTLYFSISRRLIPKAESPDHD